MIRRICGPLPVDRKAGLLAPPAYE